jgi:hypothetical protein
MIKFNLALHNPWSKHRGFTVSHWDYEVQVSEHKSFQAELYQGYADRIFVLSIDLTWTGSDHAGPGFSIILFGWEFSASFYDDRHWDYVNGCWHKYDDGPTEGYRDDE